MPTAPAAPAATPPPRTGPTAAPTPAATYNPAEHVPISPNTHRPADPKLTSALERLAGKAPPRAGERATQPAQPTAPDPAPAAPPADDRPAPHVKFIAADDQDSAPTAPSTAPTPPAPGEPPPEIIKAATPMLREAYEKLKADHHAKVLEGDVSKKELAEFRAKAKSYEERIKTLESVESRAKELEARLLSTDEQLRVSNYLQHPEFHEKYVKPVADAVTSAYAAVRDLAVEEPDGSMRPGTQADFDEVLAQPNTTLAFKKASELFGERFAATVVEDRKRVKQAQEAQARAVKDAGARSESWLKEQQGREAQARSQAREAFANASNALAAKYPALYLPAEGDREGAEARKTGEALANLVLEGQPADMPAEAYVSAIAKVHHRAAAFPVQLLRIQRLEAERDALAAKLAAYEKSSPDTASLQRPGGEPGGIAVTGPDARAAASAQMRASLERRAGVRR